MWRGTALHGQGGSAEGGPVTFGAYGATSLPKPALLGSVSASDPRVWAPAPDAPKGTWATNITALLAAATNHSGGGLYGASSYEHTITDVGNIILSSGGQERAAVKVWGVEELRQQDQFFYK